MNGPRPSAADRQANGPSGARMGSGKAPELYTLGGVRLVRADVDETSRLGPKHLALLVYLFHEQRPMHPNEVTELLGHGRSEDRENEGLRRAVVWLRDNVPGINIRLAADTIETFGGLHLDTRDVDSAIDAGDAEAVAGLYVGEFLESFQSGSPSFDEWAQRERGRLKRAWSNAMLAAAQEAEQGKRWDLAATWWRILVARAPMRPEAVSGFLRALVESGRSEEATAAYGGYLRRLRESGIAQPSDLVKRAVTELRIQVTPAEEAILSPPASDIEKLPAASEAATGKGEVPGEFESLDLIPDSEIEAALDADEAAGISGLDGLHHHLAWSDMKEEPPVGEPPAETPSAAAGTGRKKGVKAQPTKSRGFEFILPDGATVSEDTEDSPPVKGPLKPRKVPAGAFVDTTHERVRHEVTSVRKPWAPVLRETWTELAPVRSAATETLGTAGQRIWSGILKALRATRRGLGSFGRLLLAPARAVAARRRRSNEQEQERRRRAVERIQQYAPGASGAKSETKPAPPVPEPRTPRSRVPVPRVPKRPKKTAPPPVVERPKPAPPPVVERPKPAPPPVVERPKPAPPPVVERPKPVPPPVVERPKAAPPPVVERPKAAPPPVAERPKPLSPTGEISPLAPVPEPTEEAHRTEQRKPHRKGFWLARKLREARSKAKGARAKRLSRKPVSPTGRAKPTEPVPEGLRTGSLAEVGPRRKIWAKFGAARRAGRMGVPLAALFKRFWYAPVAVAVVLLGIVVGPRIAGVLGGLNGGLPSQLPEVQGPSLPKVTLPRVGVPKVTLKTPAFVETISEVFAGPLLRNPGQWLVVADVAVDPPGSAADGWQDPSRASDILTLALETDLKQAQYFYVVPRERALLARRSATGDDSEGLPVEDALAVATVENAAAVIAAAITHSEGVDSVRLSVHSPAGDTLYGVAAQLTRESTSLETLAGLTRAVRRRLGEPRDEIDASPLAGQVLSSVPDAMRLYAEAQRHFNRGRYSQAIAAAVEAVNRDSTFAMAYRTLAESYAMLGQRTRARTAIESAYDLSDRLSQREQLRILGDRHTWDGRYEEAVFTYDELFKSHRDDVVALKSQALVQKIIGARGLGQGNLKVAYSIDRYDWPPLSQIARYLDYRGRLPDVDSLVSSLDGSF